MYQISIILLDDLSQGYIKLKVKLRTKIRKRVQTLELNENCNKWHTFSPVHISRRLNINGMEQKHYVYRHTNKQCEANMPSFNFFSLGYDKLISNHMQGPDWIYKWHLTSLGNPIVEMRWSYDHLIYTLGFPILVTLLYIESGVVP